MNRLELLIYERVKTNPRLKKRIVDAYQRVLRLVPVPTEKSAYPITARRNAFFGFHDKCPWSPDDTMLLGHRFDVPLRMPLPDETIEVGYYAGPGFLEFHPVGRTRAWNWQMGSQLQWVGRSNRIIYNDFTDGAHVAHVVDLEGGQVATLPRPVAAVSPDGTVAVSHSFARLRRCASGYGYANGADPDASLLLPADRRRGLSVLQLETGEGRDLFSVADIAAIQPEPSMQGAYHYFTHPLFSPSGKRFVFFHRWLEHENQTWTRMFSCDTNGANLYLFPTSNIASHLAWRDDRHLLVYGTARPWGSTYRYFLFEDRGDGVEVIGEESFTSDGHPQFSPDGRWLLTDTYPDRFRIQRLILYDLQRNQRHDLAKVKEPFEFDDDLRCDLHPRWNRAGTIICFDSAHPGQRSLCTIALGALPPGAEPRSL